MAEKPSKEQLIEEAEAIIEKHFEQVPHLGEPNEEALNGLRREVLNGKLKKERKKYEDAIEWIRRKTKKRFEKGEK
jgi:hypothetical protein|tara:strand:+ start:9364 stop:9591 length:228 start_codon:yes stop_codon:yes gene_type:complete